MSQGEPEIRNLMAPRPGLESAYIRRPYASQGVVVKGDGLSVQPTGRLAIRIGGDWEDCSAQLGCRGERTPHGTVDHLSRRLPHESLESSSQINWIGNMRRE